MQSRQFHTLGCGNVGMVLASSNSLLTEFGIHHTNWRPVVKGKKLLPNIFLNKLGHRAGLAAADIAFKLSVRRVMGTVSKKCVQLGTKKEGS